MGSNYRTERIDSQTTFATCPFMTFFMVEYGFGLSTSTSSDTNARTMTDTLR